MNKISKIIYSFLVVIVVCLTLSLILQDALGKYRKQGNVNYRVSFATWNILINNETINNHDVLNQKLIPISINDPYIADGSIAPGSVAYCDIVIDSSKIKLPFSFSLVPISEGSMIPDLLVQDYIINPSDTNTTRIPFGNAIEGNVAGNVDSTVIRLYVTWNDETGVMSNEEDTYAAINFEDYPIYISMNFKQINE